MLNLNYSHNLTTGYCAVILFYCLWISLVCVSEQPWLTTPIIIWRYPIYQKGNPQLRVFLPNFWMKIVKPTFQQPPNIVQFVTSIEMTDYDIKNYLEKIYKLPVAQVRSEIVEGMLLFSSFGLFL